MYHFDDNDMLSFMGNEKLYFLDKYKSEIKNLVQVGAHYGYEIEFFFKTNYKNILLFEPNEKAVQVLEKKCINMSNVKIYPLETKIQKV